MSGIPNFQQIQDALALLAEYHTSTLDYEMLLKENEALKKEVERLNATRMGVYEREKRLEEAEAELKELKEKMKFLDLDGKPCDRCNEPVCYEGNEGKISKRDDAVICGECSWREEEEDKPVKRYRGIGRILKDN